jgi:hypothetical protein
MSSLSTLALKSPKRIFIWYFGNLSNSRSNSSSVLSSVGARTFRTICHQQLLSFMHDILSLTNSTLLTADMILLWTKNLYLIHNSCSPFHRKMCILPQIWCHRPPIWPHALPLNLIYISTVPSKLTLGSLTYTNSIRCIIWIVYPKYLSRS